MTDKTLPGRLDEAEIADITDKGWRMMGLSLCFAIVSAFFLPGVPEGDDIVPATQHARSAMGTDCAAADQPAPSPCNPSGTSPSTLPSTSPSRP